MSIAAVVPLVAAIVLTAVLVLHQAPPSGRLVAFRITDTGQSALVRTHAVAARTTARHRGRVRAYVELRRAHGRPLFSTATVRLRSRGRHRVAIPLSSRQVRALRSCSPATLLISAGAADARARVHPDPPVCGRFFGPQAIFNRRLAPDAPLDPSDRAVTYALLQQVADGYRTGAAPTINTLSYTAPIYTVPRHQPRVPVKMDVPSWGRRLKAAMRAGVPLPPRARPSDGSDGNLIVVQPSTDSMWEFMNLRHERDGWHAKFGGLTTDLRDFPGYYPTTTEVQGASASSLAMAGGTMLTSELRRGRIDHALAVAIPRTRAGWWSAPAQRTDGWVHEPDAVPEGAHFRLDPALDIDALHLPPVVRAMAEAAQKYGIYVRDTAGSVAFMAEDPRPYEAQNPYPNLFGQPPWELLRRFPWSHLQLLRMDLETWGGEGADPRLAQPVPPPGGPPPVCGVPQLACG